ncbi:MAG: hypothetical protein ABIJ05_05190 [Patescibacteria group bacterium]
MRNSELPPDIELDVIRAKESHLRKRFYEIAKVKNFEKGYISVPFVNQLIDLDLQGFAADIISYHIKTNNIDVDKVVGIPDSGNPLAVSVAQMLKVPLAPGRKGKAIPGAWNHPIVIEETVESFTTEETSSFVFNGLKKGDRINIVDDVTAYGYTGILAINEFRKRGIIVVGMSIYFGKLFQPGVKRIEEETGIKPFYVVGIESITPEGKINYSPPQF